MRQTKREHSWGKLSCKAITLRTDVGHLANAGAASQWIAACPGKSSKPLPVGSLPKQSDQKTYPGKSATPCFGLWFRIFLLVHPLSPLLKPSHIKTTPGKEGAMVKRKHVPASIDEVAFNCPHCGALASQSWYNVLAREITQDDRLPKSFLSNEQINRMLERKEILNEIAEFLKERAEYIKSNLILFEQNKDIYSHILAHNIYLSKCYVCNEVAVWIHDKLIFPPELYGEEPNPDMPPEILRDYEEARSILNLSPRGAAALLRLAVQKLCKHLGEKGNEINKDIGSLVRKGLSIKVQRALDIVRAIGNQAVHPGVLDLRDDRDTAYLAKT